MEKKDVFVSTIKGFITGILSLIPGLTIASVMMSTNSYDNLIEGLSSLPNKKNKALQYVAIPIIIGVVLGFIAGFKWVNIAWGKFQLQILFLLIGLFLGGIFIVFKKEKLILSKKNILIPLGIITIAIVLIYVLKDTHLVINNIFIKTIFLGLITSMSLVIPGISVSSVHVKGEYDVVLNAIKHLTVFNNILVVCVFSIIVLLVLLTAAKIIKKCTCKNKNITYIILCSLVFVNIIILCIQVKSIKLDFTTIFTSLLSFLWGFIFAKNVAKE